MSPAASGPDPLPVRRSYRLERSAESGEPVRGVVVEIDATAEPRALAVQQAGLHPLAPGDRLGYGYDLSVYGLGAWVDDRRVQLRVWPVVARSDGTIDEDDPDHPEAEVLVIHFHPRHDADALDGLADTGRLFIAGPDAGPTPLVLDLDRRWVADVLTATGDAAPPPPDPEARSGS